MLNIKQKVTRYELSINCCRICLRKSGKFRSIFEPFEDGDIPPNEKLKLVTGIIIDQHEEKVPMVICKTCEISLNMAYTFRTRAIKSDQIISIYCSRNNKKSNIVIALDNGRKFTLSKDLTFKVVNKTNGNSFDLKNTTAVHQVSSVSEPSHYVDSEDDNSLQEEFIDAPLVQEPFESSTALMETDIEDSACDDVTEGSISEDLQAEEENVPKIAINSFSNAESRIWLKAGTHESDNRIKPSVSEVDKVNENEINSHIEKYICEKCGNIFSKKQRLMEHVKRHTTEKDFICEICNKRFAVGESLRRHILTHGAVKPFQCRFCSRRFFNPSSRKAHEIIHSGVKPHVCNVCGRAFAYSCSLQKHLLIHKDIKYYYCTCCRKEFRLLQHLKQHEETLIHKRTFDVYTSQTNS